MCAYFVNQFQQFYKLTGNILKACVLMATVVQRNKAEQNCKYFIN